MGAGASIGQVKAKRSIIKQKKSDWFHDVCFRLLFVSWSYHVFAYGSKAVRAFLRFLTFVVDCKLT